MQSKITYPQFRKYQNDKAFFKILSDTAWEEIQVIGSKYTIKEYKVSILPDRNFLHDLTFDYKKYWVEIMEKEYERVKEKLSIN